MQRIIYTIAVTVLISLTSDFRTEFTRLFSSDNHPCCCITDCDCPQSMSQQRCGESRSSHQAVIIPTTQCGPTYFNQLKIDIPFWNIRCYVNPISHISVQPDTPPPKDTDNHNETHNRPIDIDLIFC